MNGTTFGDSIPRTTWDDAHKVIGSHVLVREGFWENDEHSSALFKCPSCGQPETLQLIPQSDGSIKADCLSDAGCSKRKVVKVLRESWELSLRRRKPDKVRVTEPFNAGDRSEFWSPSPSGDAWRLLDRHGDKLLLVDRPGDWPVAYVLDLDTGLWRDSPNDLMKLHIETISESCLKAHTLLEQGSSLMSRDTFLALFKWQPRTASPQATDNCRKALLASHLGMIERGLTPKTRAVVKDSDLDADKRYLGCLNGVVDLDTGELLDAAEGATKHVTRSTGVTYRLDAQDDFIDDLLSHLEADDRCYLLDATAYSLRGNPGRRWYLLKGPPGSGKTTFLRAVGHALGTGEDGYAFGMASGALLKDKHGGPNAHTEHLTGFTKGRFAYSSELPDNGQRFNEGLLKQLTGGDDVAYRAIHERAAPARPASATIFMAVNPKDMDRLSLLDAALADRTAILRWPAFSDGTIPDVDRVNAVTRPQAAEAMLAMLVRRVRDMKSPPANIPSVADEVAALRRDALGTFGNWLIERVKVTGGPFDYIVPDALWATAYEELDGENDRIGAFDRKGMTSLLRECVQGLPNQTSRRVDGKRVNVYQGIKLLEETEDIVNVCVAGCGTQVDGPNRRCRGCVVKAEPIGYVCIHGAACPECADRAQTVRLVIENGQGLMALLDDDDGDESWMTRDALHALELAMDAAESDFIDKGDIHE